jgi:cytochrome c
MSRSSFELRWLGFTVLAGSFVATAVFAHAGDAGSATPGARDPQVAFNTHCRTCHSGQPGDHRLGPSLHGVMGRKAGSVEGFAFSPGFKTTDLTWDAATMDRFIANPNAVFPGSNMATFPGLADAGERVAIIAHLKTLR